MIKHYVQMFTMGIMLLTLAGCSSKERIAEVKDVAWQTLINVEEYKEVKDSGWVLPDDAELITTRIETKAYKKVLEYYRREETLGYYYYSNSRRYYMPGTVDDVPVYKWLPIEAPKYYYKQMQWVYKRVAMREGFGHKIKWADPGLTDGEREGSKEVNYYVELKIGDKADEYIIDEDLFSELYKGDKIKCTIDGSTVVDVVQLD